jgi:uncharacterized protein (DUF983 family)
MNAFAQSPWRLLLRGLTKRCPKCGSGKLFKHWTAMVSECPTCAYHFEREEGFFLGAMVVNIAITEALIIGVIAIGFGVTLPNPPLVKLAVIAGLGGFLMPFLAYPFTKTTWSAVDMIMRGSMGESYGRTGGRQPGTRLKRPDQVKRSDQPEQRE